jgi:hypothetical protein
MAQPQLGRFGDRRLASVGDSLLAAMQKQRTMCLHALAENRSQARQFHRFLDNEAVSTREMLVQAGRRTAERAAGRHVLAITDTSELNYATHTGRKRGFGTVGNGEDLGVLLHPVIAVDAEQGGLIGLVGAEVINRAESQSPLAATKKACLKRRLGAETLKRRPADEKESRRWLAGAETAGAVLADAAMITMVEDREGDIYDQFARACPCEGGRPDNVHLLVRAARSRMLEDNDRLFERCAAWSAVTQHTIRVPAKHGKVPRAERTAVVAVRYGEVTVKRPRRADDELPETLSLRVVDVREVDPPADPDQRVHWCLLTTHAVGSTAEAMRIVAWYRLRWIIEQVFRTMKTDGVDVETSQITTPGSLLKLVTVALLAAIRVMQLVIGRDGSTGQELMDVADPIEVPALQAISTSLEGPTEKLKNPFDPASLAWYAWVAARLGGWSGYTSKGYKPPGPKTMARGLKRLDAMVQGWMLANRSAVVGLP